MQPPPKPVDETKRLAALRALSLLDTPAEERFDRITRVAQRALGTPIALISLIDADRQWFKSAQGLQVQETPRELSFCGHTILGDALLVVPDAIADERFRDNPLVAGEPNIRFYAGCPLAAPDGSRVGTLGVIDTAPRELGEGERALLLDLARIAERELAALSMAVTDSLTGLHNRAGFEVLAHYALLQCQRADLPATLLFFDLNGFRLINDDRGRDVGDQALRDLAEVMRVAFRDSDVLGRLSGDQFVVLLTGSTDDTVARLLDRFRDELQHYLSEAGRDYALGFSVGKAGFDPQRPTALARLMGAADAEVYAQKEANED